MVQPESAVRRREGGGSRNVGAPTFKVLLEGFLEDCDLI